MMAFLHYAPPPSCYRGWPLPFSTATQRTAGEDCRSEDPPDELGPSLAERALRVKAIKLEKEVQDLTVSRFYICSSYRLSSLNVHIKFFMSIFKMKFSLIDSLSATPHPSSTPC